MASSVTLPAQTSLQCPTNANRNAAAKSFNRVEASRFFSFTPIQLQSESKSRSGSLKVRSSLSNPYLLVAEVKKKVNVEEWNNAARLSRLQHLESQAMVALKTSIENFENPTFPCALIAGDVVILELLHKLNAFKEYKVKVVFVDTFHLFPETYQFLKDCEERYNFKAEVFKPLGLDSKEEYDAKHGSDLFEKDVDEYDKICKVEPFGRALKTLKVDVMINGRRRDHGAERAHLGLFEAGGMVKVQPLAYWEFKDCFDYLKANGIPYHPLHDAGYPSIGDIQSTVPVPQSQWFEYAGERSGRFQGLKNKDGTLKTECGIHVGDAREVAQS